MHMKDDHVRNAQLKLTNNIQIAVDAECIIAADIFGDRNDVWMLVTFLKRMEERLGFNYTSETEILYRINRAIQIEGVFGVLKNDYEFERFLLHGKTKVKLEIFYLV